MKILITAAIVLTGCTIQYTESLDPEDVAAREKWDGSKGQFPPGFGWPYIPPYK